MPITSRRAIGRSATPRRSRSTRVLGVLKPLLEDPGVAKIGHDLKFDAIVLARHGVRLGGLDFDTMIASYLVDATRSTYPLEELALEHTAYKALTEEDVCGKGVKALSIGDIPGGGGPRLRVRAGRPCGAARADSPRAARQGAADRGVPIAWSCR